MHHPSRRRHSPKRPLARRPRSRPIVEQLEDRVTPSTLIPFTAGTVRDHVFDAGRNLLYITRNNGFVERYDVASGTLLAPLSVGTSLNGLDITPDGNFLYVAEGQLIGGQGVVRKVNLNTETVTDLTFTPVSLESGAWDIAIANNGKALFDARFAGSGGVSLRQIDLTTDAISTRRGVQQDTHIHRGADRSLMFFTESNISSGPIFTYDAVTDTFPSSSGTGTFHGSTLSAVNRNGTLIAMELSSGITVMNRTLGAVQTLASVDGGMAFDPLRDTLYAVNSTTDEIIAYNTNTWAERFRVPVEQNVSASTAFGSGVMTISSDGRLLFLSVGNGVRVYDLPNNPGVVASLEVSGFPSFIGQGTSGTFTVTAQDNLGDVVTNYTGTVTFTSTDGAAALPSSYTFTLADQGRRTFNATFNTVGTHTLTAREPAPSTITGTQTGIVVHAPGAALIPVLNHRDLVYDATRGLLYITTTSGRVERYDPVAGTLLAPYAIGNTLNGADITPDGNFLYVAEGQQVGAGGIVRKVNLSTGAATSISYNGGAGTWDIAITNNGRAFFDSRFAGSGSVNLNQIDLTTDVVTTRRSVNQDTNLARGADRSFLFITQANSSGGPITAYNPATDSFAPDRGTAAFYDNQLLSVNRTGMLVATELGFANSGGNYYGVSIMDRNLNAVQNLGPNFDGGILFDPTRDLLYAIDSAVDQIVAFDTTTWAERFRINVGENLSASTVFGSGVMEVSSDGQFLFLGTPLGVRVIGLPGNPGVVSQFQVSGFPSFTGQGTAGTFTVTALDALGSVVTNYTGTVTFTSSDGSAVLPDSYTFTLADQGRRTFNATFNTVGTHTLTARDLATPTITGTQSGITIHNGQVTLLPVANRRDQVFDATRGLLYLTTGSGQVQRYNPTTKTLLAPLHVGTVLNGLDITPDGNFLYVAENVRGATQGFVRKVNLNSGAVTNLAYNVGGGEAGSWDIAIANNGKALFDTRFEGSGGVSLRQIDLATDAISTRRGVQQDTHIHRAADRSLMFFTESNISSGPIFTYDAVTDTFPSSSGTGTFHGSTLSAVNRNGTRIAMELGSGISVLDRSLTAVQSLASVDGGMVFDPLRDTLYAVNSTTDQIIAYNTNNWAERFRIPVGQNVGTSTPLDTGVMTISADSRLLFLSVAGGVRVYELPGNPGVLASLQVSGFPSFISQGVRGTFTVIAQDNLGDTVTNYTGTVTFTSTDGSAVLPANYTFTLADQGRRTFNATFNTVGTHTLTVRDLAVPTITGSQSGIVVHAPGAALIPVLNHRDLVYDPVRGLLYITTNNGTVQRYDPNTGTLLAPFSIGNVLNGADITPEGNFLYVAEAQQVGSQSVLRKVNLDTGTVTTLPYSDGAGAWDIAIANNGRAFFDSQFAGSGWVNFYQLDLATDAITPRTDSRGSGFGGQVRQNTHIARAADRSLLFMAESNISSGPIFTYDAATNTFPSQLNLGLSLSSVMTGVNRNGTQVAVQLFNGLQIRDRNLAPVQTLSGIDGGIAFDPVRDTLYGVNSSTDQIIAYNTNTWAERFRITIGENVSTSSPFGNGVMTVSDDGQYLFLATATGVRLYRIGDQYPLIVGSLTPTTTGFNALLSRPINPALLNMYDEQNGTLGPADVVVTGPDGQPVRGSVILNATNTAFTFIATSGTLAPGLHTVTLRSAANGFKDTANGLLDGNNDGTTGDDFTTTFTVAASSAVVVSVPNVARGPGQPVNVPATATGLPLRLSNGAGVTSISLTLRYDPNLLTITGASTAIAGTTVSADLSIPGIALLTFSSPTALSAGAVDFLILNTTVPNDAPYTHKHVLNLVNVRINGGAIASRDDDAVHVVGYLGEVTGNGTYSSSDAVRILRVGVGLDSGFAVYQNLDPVIVADITGNDLVNATDATRILQEAIGIDRPEVPQLPGTLVIVLPPGPDPLLNLPTHFRNRPGEMVTVPVNLDISDGVETADLAITYDPRRLEIRADSDIRRGSLTTDFDVFAVNHDPLTGTIRVAMGRTTGALRDRGAGSVLEITFRVKSNAPPGPAVINLRQNAGATKTQLNEDRLDLNPDPSNQVGDALDGIVRIMGRERPATSPTRSLPQDEKSLMTFLLAELADQGKRESNPQEVKGGSEPAWIDFFFGHWGESTKAEEDDWPSVLEMIQSGLLNLDELLDLVAWYQDLKASES